MLIKGKRGTFDLGGGDEKKVQAIIKENTDLDYYSFLFHLVVFLRQNLGRGRGHN